jgi:pimeloyl-ACP methyl ester carboxylesterase
MNETFVTVDDVRVHLLRSEEEGDNGERPPLLYLHGTAPSGRWLPVHEQLTERFSVYAPDLPGFGGTEAPEWVEGMDDLLLHLRELLDALGLARPHVVGYSLGGWLAAELAVFYPERVGGLVLAAAPGLHVAEATVADLFALGGERLARTLFHNPADASLFFSSSPTVEERVRQYRELTMLARLAWNPSFDPKLRRRLRRVASPTLLLWGAEDRLVPPAHGEAYRAALPDARLTLLPECGHMAPLERPDAFAAAIIAFLEERCGGSSSTTST